MERERNLVLSKLERQRENETWFYQNQRDVKRTKLGFNKTRETERERNLFFKNQRDGERI